MHIITRIALRHLKLNKTRTTFTILCVTLSVCIMILISVFLETMLDLMIRSEIDQNGSWHMEFHELTAEQANSLYAMSVFRSVEIETETNTEDTSLFSAKVEFQKADRRIYERAQTIAKKIDMKEHIQDGEPLYQIPDQGLSPYNIDYHYNLLQFYGAANIFESHSILPISSVFTTIYILLAFITAVFIYHAYSTSASELVRYMGLLGSIGATRYQKRVCILIESAVTTGIGLLIGCFLGFLSSFALLHLGTEWIQDLTGANVPPKFIFSFWMLALAIICICISTFAACFIPANRVSKMTIMAALQHRTKTHPISKVAHLPDVLRKHCSAEVQMAFKNITYNKMRYIGIIIPLLLSMCLFLMVYVYLGYKNGSYDLGNNRIYEQNSIRLSFEEVPEAKIEEFFNELKKEPSVKRVRMYKEFISGAAAALPANYIQPINGMKPQYFYTSTLGTSYSNEYLDQNDSNGNYFPFWIHIYGLDNDAYNAYLEKCEISAEDFSAPPVIIEDSLIYRLGNKDILGGSVSLPDKKNAQILLNTPWDEYFFAADQAPHVVKGYLISFSNACITTQTSPINFGDKPGKSINNFFSIYLPMDQFESLVNTKALQDLKTKDYSLYDTYIDLEPRRAQAASFSQNNAGLFHLLSKAEITKHANEDAAFLKRVEAIAASIDLETSHVINPVITDKMYFTSSEWAKLEAESENPYPYILQIFSYGILILIAVFCLSNIISSMSASMAVRKREFPVLQSMGMTVKNIRKMLLIENSISAIFICIFGIPASILCEKIVAHSLRQERGLDIFIPNWIFLAEAAFILIIIFISIISALRQCSKINIIETIRNENI